MDDKERQEAQGLGPAEERAGGDEVAGDARSGRTGGAAGSGFAPRGAPRRTARTVAPDAERVAAFTGEQRLLLLDAWLRSKLPATEFATLVGVTPTTLYGWRKRFEEQGPAALMGHRRGARGSQLPEPTRRAILMMKQAHPEWGQDRIHDMLVRSEGLEASARAVQRVLLEAGYEVEEAPTRPHPSKAKRFERTRPNELWQTDLFTFVLKRQRQRVHLVAYLDDFSRFVVGYGLHASASGALVREVLEQAIANFGASEEVLTDNGAQYHTWRGKSAFARLCERRGIKQIVASPRRPQTLGKIERFWGTLWRELLEGAVFRDLEEARTRLGHFVSFYNFQRTHQGIDGLVPADRYFEAAPEVRTALEKRVAENARALALHGEALRLEWRDVDFRRCVVTVRRSKNKTGREVPFTTRGRESLQVSRARHDDRAPRVPDLVFPGLVEYALTGESRLKTTARKTWNRARKRAGLPDLRLHDLRHVWAVTCVRAGVSLSELRELGGWKSLHMVLRYSRHVPDNTPDRARMQLESFVQAGDDGHVRSHGSGGYLVAT